MLCYHEFSYQRAQFFLIHCLSELYCVLVTNPPLLRILVSIVLTLVTNLSYTVFLSTSLSAKLLSLLKAAGTVLSLPLFSFDASVDYFLLQSFMLKPIPT